MQKVVFVPLLEWVSDRFLFLPVRCVLFCCAAGHWSFELFVFPPPFTRFSLFFFFCAAQKSVPEVSIRKVRRRVSVFTLIAGSDLLSVVKDIAGSVALPLTRVNWVSFSFSQQHGADRIEKERKESFSELPVSANCVFHAFPPFLLSRRRNARRGSCIFWEASFRNAHEFCLCLCPQRFTALLLWSLVLLFKCLSKSHFTFSSSAFRTQPHSNYPIWCKRKSTRLIKDKRHFGKLAAERISQASTSRIPTQYVTCKCVNTFLYLWVMINGF